MKGKKRAFIVPLLLAAIFLSLCGCGGEAQAPEMRLKEVRFVADGTDAGALMYTYDENGNPVRLEATDVLFEEDLCLLDYEYDAEGRLTSVKGTDEYGDAAGLIIQYSGEDGITQAVLSIDEDGDGVPDEDGAAEFTFDADGYMLSRNFEGATTEWTYDEAHRVMEEYRANSLTDTRLITFTYDDNGNLIEKCYYYFVIDEFLGRMIADAGLRPNKLGAESFQRNTYDDLQFNDEGLLTSKNGELWDSDGYIGDVTIDYTYDDDGDLLLEKNAISDTSGVRQEITTYHSGNDACRVLYYKYDKAADVIADVASSSCEILSDQLDFISAYYDIYAGFSSTFSADFYFPYGGSIRFIPPEGEVSLDLFPALDLSDVFDFYDTESYLPANLEFTEDGYLSKLDYGAENYVEFIYETAE